jgi:hypothetical protein
VEDRVVLRGRLGRERAGSGEQDLITVHLERALEGAGCALCRLREEGEDRWLWTFLWENVNDPDLRAALHASDGFCQWHWWRLNRVEREKVGSTIGFAILAEDLAPRALAPPARLTRCMPCLATERSEGTYARRLARSLAAETLRQRLAAGGALCLPHLASVLALLSDPSRTRLLLECWRDGLLREADGGPAEAGREADGRMEMRGEKKLPSSELGPRVEQGLDGPDCAICTVAAEASERWLVASLRSNLDERQALQEAGWLCREDLAQLEAAAAGQGARAAEVDRLRHDLRERCVALVEGALEGPRLRPSGSWGAWRGRLAAGGLLGGLGVPSRRAVLKALPCPACTALRWSEDEVATWLGSQLGEGAWQERVRVGSLLCRRHLPRTIATAGTAEGRWLTEQAAKRIRELADELREYVRKSDWNARNEAPGAERDSWMRAIRFLGGSKRIIRRDRQGADPAG